MAVAKRNLEEIGESLENMGMNKKGAKNIENQDDEICKRLRIIFRKNAHKRPAEEQDKARITKIYYSKYLIINRYYYQ